MKLVVPLTIPVTRRIRSPASDSRRSRMSGIPPPTAASNNRSTPAVAAASNSSCPTLATSSLLAVTTGLPALRAARIRVRAGSIPPMTSTMTSTDGSATTAAASWVSRLRSTAAGRSRVVERTATGPTSRRKPVRPAMTSASRVRIVTSALPTLPHPRIPTRTLSSTGYGGYRPGRDAGADIPVSGVQAKENAGAAAAVSGIDSEENTRAATPACGIQTQEMQRTGDLGSGIEPEEIVGGLPPDDNPVLAAGDEDHGRPRHLVVVRRHRMAVRTSHGRGEDVADLGVGGELGGGDHDVPRFAVLTDHPHAERPLGHDGAGKEGLVAAAVQHRTGVVAHPA